VPGFLATSQRVGVGDGLGSFRAHDVITVGWLEERRVRLSSRDVRQLRRALAPAWIGGPRQHRHPDLTRYPRLAPGTGKNGA
jgi:hypothetical protein